MPEAAPLIIPVLLLGLTGSKIRSFFSLDMPAILAETLQLVQHVASRSPLDTSIGPAVTHPLAGGLTVDQGDCNDSNFLHTKAAGTVP